MKTLQDSGKYTVKDTGEQIIFEFEYPCYDSVDEVINTIGEEKTLAMLNQTTKEDVANNTREKTKVENGHSTRKVLSEEEKLQNKQERKLKKDLAEACLKKGMTIEDILNL